MGVVEKIQSKKESYKLNNNGRDPDFLILDHDSFTNLALESSESKSVLGVVDHIILKINSEHIAWHEVSLLEQVSDSWDGLSIVVEIDPREGGIGMQTFHDYELSEYIHRTRK